MPKIFDEFDLELEKVDMDVVLFGSDGGDSIAICGDNGSGGMVPSTAPTCFNVCA